MADIIELAAVVRAAKGKRDAAGMRKDGRVPAVVYGGETEPQSVSLVAKDVTKLLNTGHFQSTVYMLDIDGQKTRVIPREVQLHPVRDTIQHVDFLRVTKSSRIDVAVPVVFLNEDTAPGLKQGGVLNIVSHEIELSCPADGIPETIEVDLDGLTIGDSVHISAVKLPAGVKPTDASDFTVATIAPPAAEETDTPASTPDGEAAE